MPTARCGFPVMAGGRDRSAAAAGTRRRARGTHGRRDGGCRAGGRVVASASGNRSVRRIRGTPFQRRAVDDDLVLRIGAGSRRRVAKCSAKRRDVNHV